MQYTVTPILAGEFGPVSDHIKYRNGNHTTGEHVPSYIFHVQSEESSIVVDMSFSSVEKCQSLMGGLKFDRSAPLEEILAQNGVVPDKVDKVICTHLHWDHAGNGKLFPNASIICQREELAHAVAPKAWDQGYSRDFVGELLEVMDRVEVVDGNVCIQEGLEVVKVGGHSPGGQAVVINTAQGKVIIPGDVVMTYRNLTESIPIGLFTSLQECVDAISWLNGQAAVVLPGHDWKTLDYGKKG